MFGTAPRDRPDALMKASLASYAVLTDRVRTMVPEAIAEAASLRSWAIAHGIAAQAVDGQLDHAGASPAELADHLLRLDAAMLAG